MTILIIRITFALGVVGHAVNMYCDRILSIFPNGTIKLDNIKEIEKEGVLAKMMEGVSADVPMRSAILGVLAMILEFFSYIALAFYTYGHSHAMGIIMFVTAACFCIIGAAYHVKYALAEYVFIKLGRDNEAKDLMLEVKDSAPILKLCMVGMVIYIVTLIVGIVTGIIGFPIWAVVFTTLPIVVLLFPFKIIGTLHIAAMVSMLAWMFLI